MNRWLHQQQNAFWDFFEGGMFESILDKLDFELIDLKRDKKAIVSERQHQYTRVLLLSLRHREKDHLQINNLYIPQPNKNGIFLKNGTKYYAPIQRVVSKINEKNNTHKFVEYRNLKHVLADQFFRKKLKESENTIYEQIQNILHKKRIHKTNRRGLPYVEVIKTEEDRCREIKRKFYHALLNPFGGETLYQCKPYSFGKKCQLIQVKTYNMVGIEYDEKQLDIKTNIKCSIDGVSYIPFPKNYTYDYIQYCKTLGSSVRKEVAGLDPVHSPEGENIGLNRYLNKGVYLNDDRTLNRREETTGSIALRQIPFRNNNDPRRLLMGCNMQMQAVNLKANENPLITPMKSEKFSPPGVNLLTGFLPSNGNNHEDAIVISKTGAKKLKTKEIKTINVPIESFVNIRNVNNNKFEKGILREGVTVKKGDLLCQKEVCFPHLGFKPTDIDPDWLNKDSTNALFYTKKLSHGFDVKSNLKGTVVNTEYNNFLEHFLNASEKEKPLFEKIRRFKGNIKIEIKIERPCRIGDKLANRFGNKGIVGNIVSDDQMPRLEGKPVEILLNPLGVVNRGNFGQLYEAVFSWDGYKQNDYPEPNAKNLFKLQEKLGLDTNSFSSFEMPDGTITSGLGGYNFIMRLPHHADKKLKSVSKCKPHSLTGLPPRRLAQRYGEMEMWSLQAYNAKNILIELCNSHCFNSSKITAFEMLFSRLKMFLICLGYHLQKNSNSSKKEFNLKPLNKSDLDESKDIHTPVDKKSGIPSEHKLRERVFSNDYFLKNKVYSELPKELIIEPFDGFPITNNFLYILPPYLRTTNPPDYLSRLYEDLVKIIRNHKNKCNDNKSTEKEEQVIKNKVEAIYKQLIKKIGDKEGLLRRDLLGRRLYYSARGVISPGPELSINKVSLPWDAVKDIYRPVIRKIDSVRKQNLLNKSQEQLTEKEKDFIRSKVVSRLKDYPVLMNRNPSLHRYSIMAFTPQVHFDSSTFRMPLAVLGPFGADFDGDTMTAVPVFEEDSRREAKKLFPEYNCIHCVTGDEHFTPDNEIEYAYLKLKENGELDDLLPDKKENGISTEDYELAWMEDNEFSERLKTIYDKCLEYLSEHPFSIPLGDFATVKKYFDEFPEGIVKDNYLSKEDNFIEGIEPERFKQLCRERIGIMIEAEMHKGNFGGVLRRYYYSLKHNIDDNGGREKFKTLIALQTVTERATQKALSVKKGDGPLPYYKFMKLLKGILGGKKDLEPTEALDQLCAEKDEQGQEWLDFNSETKRFLKDNLTGRFNEEKTEQHLMLKNFQKFYKKLLKDGHGEFSLDSELYYFNC